MPLGLCFSWFGRVSQAGVAGWPDFDPDLAEEPGLIEPNLSAIRCRVEELGGLDGLGCQAGFGWVAETWETGKESPNALCK